jgi:Holliday junction resolvase RusA-like endonuclease
VIHVYPITPVPAPRQTRADQWKDPPRPPVARYRAYCDELRLRQVRVPEPFHHAVFVLPMPPSWRVKQRAAHEGMPHQQKPDRDNLEKALLDALFENDASVWDGRTTKLWGTQGLLILSAQPIGIVLPFDLSEYYASVRVANGIGARLAPRTPI